MNIDELTVRKIKEAAGIVDVMGDFLELRKRGQDYECLCPFHNDRHLGSFKVSPRRNTFHCFSCEAKGGPIDFLMKYNRMTYPDALRWLAAKYSIDIPGESRPSFARAPRLSKPRPLQPQPAELPTLILPNAMMDARRDTRGDTLADWMRSLNWNGEQRRRLETMLRNYCIGKGEGDMAGFTIFWNVDEQGRVHTGKLMKYRPDGHRIKDGYTRDWIHSLLKRKTANRYGIDQTCEPRIVLFGLHLLDFCPGATVNIVESEKTAILAAAYWGNMRRFIWLATGGMQFLDRTRLEPIIKENRRIVLYPDKDGEQRWREAAVQTGYDRISVNTYYLDHYWQERDGPKADIGDIIVRRLTKDGGEARQTEAPPPRTTAPQPLPPLRLLAAKALRRMEGVNPNIKPLVDNLKLEPISVKNDN